MHIKKNYFFRRKKFFHEEYRHLKIISQTTVLKMFDKPKWNIPNWNWWRKNRKSKHVLFDEEEDICLPNQSKCTDFIHDYYNFNNYQTYSNSNHNFDFKSSEINQYPSILEVTGDNTNQTIDHQQFYSSYSDTSSQHTDISGNGTANHFLPTPQFPVLTSLLNQPSKLSSKLHNAIFSIKTPLFSIDDSEEISNSHICQSNQLSFIEKFKYLFQNKFNNNSRKENIKIFNTENAQRFVIGHWSN